MALMFFDEFYYHHKRGLGTWEKWGHPLDTLTVVLAWLFIITSHFEAVNLLYFTGIAIFSCLFITKDEWVHSKECQGTENWLHALLFVIHPIIFMVMAALWAIRDGKLNLFFSNVNGLNALSALPIEPAFVGGLIISLGGLSFGFMAYQIIYWNFYAKNTN